MTIQIAAHGRLGEDPKEIATSSGKAMAVASLAVSIEERGAGDPPPLWIGILAFGRTAEELLRHRRGDLLSVAGRLQRKRWTDRDGRERERLEVVADSLVSARTVRPAGGRKREGERSGAAAEARHAVRAQAPAHAGPGDQIPFRAEGRGG